MHIAIIGFIKEKTAAKKKNIFVFCKRENITSHSSKTPGPTIGDTTNCLVLKKTIEPKKSRKITLC